MPSVRLAAFLLFAALSWAEAGNPILQEDYDSFQNSSIAIESIFAPAAPNGAVPFRVVIQNNTGEDRTWTIDISEGNYGRTLKTETTRQIAVKSGAKVEHEILFPLAPAFTANPNRMLEFRITSPGMPAIERSENYQTVRSLPMIAMSRPLATRSLSRLNQLAQDRNSGDQRFADPFDPADLPTSWLSYTSLDVIMLDFASWKSISEAQRRAITEWTRMGGQLNLFVTEEDSTGNVWEKLGIHGLLLVKPGDKSARLSLGSISLREWDGREVGNQIVGRFAGKSSRAKELDEDYDASWSLADDFGSKEFHSGLIFLLLLLFAIFVAPVNLFYFAKPGRRHRLFITTPIISLIACLIVVALIFLGDGLGGRGMRTAFADLQSEESEQRLYLTQEQLSRTGVMFQSGFNSKRQLALDPVNLRPSPFNFLSRSRSQSTTFRFEQGAFQGGFFKSRSEQGFSARTVEASRARIRVTRQATATEAPQLISNLPSAIDEFCYRDSTGKTWQSSSKAAIAPGSPIPLEPIPEETHKQWIYDATETFSDGLQNRVRRLQLEKNRFFATSTDPSDILIETHPGIRWENDQFLLSGNALRSTSAPDVNE